MAEIYCGDDKINIGVVKEVKTYIPSQQDVIEIGNAMRDAYAYSYKVTGRKFWQIYDFNNNLTTELIEADNIKLPSFSNHMVIIDGKLYEKTVSNGNIILTQIGTQTDWQDANDFIYIRGNKIFKKESDATRDTNSIMAAVNPKLNKGKDDYLFINDGKLYIEDVLIDDSGVWSHISRWLNTRYSLGICDKKVVSYVISNDNLITKSEVMDLSFIDNVDDILFGCDADICLIGYRNKLWYILFNYGDGSIKSINPIEYDDNIIDITNGRISGNMGLFVLMENGVVRKYSDNSYRITEIMTNVKMFCSNKGTYVLGNDNKVYDISTSTPSEMFTLENVPMFAKHQSDTINGLFEYSDSDSNFAIDTIYTVKYNNATIGYSDYTSSISSFPITNRTNNEIIVNDNTYVRDASRDKTFTFIPDDLENYTFTDQDLCKLYLRAGLS